MYRDQISNPSADAEQFLASLRTCGLRARIALAVDDPHTFALCFHRILAEGGTPILAPSAQEASELGAALQIHGHGIEPLPEPHLPPQEDTYIAFSSGSTGQRRALFFSQERARANALAHSQALNLSDTDLLVQTLRLHHPFGVVAYLFAPLVSGCSVELGTYFDGAFSQRQRPSVVHLTPYHLELLKSRGFRARGLVSKLTVGAAPLSLCLARYASQLCHELHSTYGLSEAGPRVTSGRVELEQFVDGWVGYPLDGVQCHLSTIGELCLQTPYAHLGSSQIRSGDRMEMRSDGSLIFRDRLRDLLRVRGQTVSRTSVQTRLQAALGRPCEVAQRPYSDALVLFVEGPPEQVEPDWRRSFPEFRNAQLVWVESFARTDLGKVDCQQMLRESEPDPP